MKLGTKEILAISFGANLCLSNTFGSQKCSVEVPFDALIAILNFLNISKVLFTRLNSLVQDVRQRSALSVKSRFLLWEREFWPVRRLDNDTVSQRSCGCD